MLPSNILIINWICELQGNREPGIGILITDHLQIKKINMIIIRQVHIDTQYLIAICV